MYWNYHGATRKRLELINFVQEKKVDILLLKETHLPTNSTIKLLNYQLLLQKTINKRPPPNPVELRY